MASDSERRDWMFGTGASPGEKALAYATGSLAAVLFLLSVRDLNFSWWQNVLGVILVLDLVGGVVANALDSCRRFYHSRLDPPGNAVTTFAHSNLGFVLLHIQPIAVGLLFPGGSPWWGLLWYAWSAVSTIAVIRAPQRLQRPVAMACTALGVMAAPLVAGPAGFTWLPAILLLKLVVAHAVPPRTAS